MTGSPSTISNRQYTAVFDARILTVRTCQPRRWTQGRQVEFSCRLHGRRRRLCFAGEPILTRPRQRRTVQPARGATACPTHPPPPRTPSTARSRGGILRRKLHARTDAAPQTQPQTVPDTQPPTAQYFRYYCYGRTRTRPPNQSADAYNPPPHHSKSVHRRGLIDPPSMRPRSRQPHAPLSLPWS